MKFLYVREMVLLDVMMIGIDHLNVCIDRRDVKGMKF
jgi:hypothetical protein